LHCVSQSTRIGSEAEEEGTKECQTSNRQKIRFGRKVGNLEVWGGKSTNGLGKERGGGIAATWYLLAGSGITSGRTKKKKKVLSLIKKGKEPKGGLFGRCV